MLTGPMAMLHHFHTHPNCHAETNHPGLRRTLIEEEATELIEACDLGDRLKIAREVADVLYVAYGTAWVYRIDGNEAFRIIHAKAMEKMEAGVRRGDGKLIKPPCFVPPNLIPSLRRLDAW